MRLHSLSVTAFGPFADTVEVDFDSLAEAAVFLLCGEIGAGKTMVLDAVCFALYGDVPTDRGRARQLRSHFAADGTAPRVVLEVSVGVRRWRFSRSPVWTRPKRRGTGTTTEQASALVEELVDGAWTTRATRLDEAGLLVGDLLGMTLAQFSQVVMLPQGQFDTFLRASSEERQRLLTRLFRTRRFEDVERWLVERRTTLRRAGEGSAARVAELLHRLSEATDTELPEWGDLSAVADDGRLSAWLADLGRVVTADADDAGVDRDAAAAELETWAAAHAEGQRVQHLQRRGALAQAELEALAATSDHHLRDRIRLDAGRRAALVVAPRRLADRARVTADRSDAEADRALSAVAGLLDDVRSPTPVDPDLLERRAVEAAERAAVAEQFVPRAHELSRARERRRDLQAEVDRLVARREPLVALRDELPGLVAEVEASLPALRRLAGSADAVRATLVRLARRASGYATMTELEFQVADFGAKRDHQQVVLLDLRQRLLDVRETRLRGMAAELAAAMAVGGSCPVCGSHDHPAPAVAAPDAPDALTEQRLQRELDDAEVVRETLQDQVRSYAARLATAAAELAGTTEEQTVAELAGVEAELTAAVRAGEDLTGREAELAALRTSLREADDALAVLDTTIAVKREQSLGNETAIETLTAELARLLDDVEDPVGSLTAQATHDRRAAAALATARDALAERARRRELRARTERELDDAAGEAGFDSPEEAQQAELDPAAIDRLEAACHERATREAAARATLTEADVVAAAAQPEPDLLQLADGRRRATDRHATATARAELAARRVRRLAVATEALHEELDAWAPVRQEYGVVRSLSELAEGKGPDNPLQVRLSAYVLASRLSEVVAAANERLRAMTDGRFLLEHTADRGVGERRGGLSLLVRDLWTDVARDPVTLSGGETFVVSLALALGLADVVTAEAGGAHIDTLFVDEGFGSLDTDTLELVMDTLDDLRSGGRVVGVVSHVPELQDRIPAQLLVHKGRAGSWLEQRDRSVGSTSCP